MEAEEIDECERKKKEMVVLGCNAERESDAVTTSFGSGFG